MPTSPVHGANVIPDLIVMSEDKPNALDAPLANDIAGSAVNVLSVKLKHKRYEPEWLSIEKFTNTTSPLHMIQRSQVKSLVESVRALTFAYPNGMFVLTWSVGENRTYSSTEVAIG